MKNISLEILLKKLNQTNFKIESRSFSWTFFLLFFLIPQSLFGNVAVPKRKILILANWSKVSSVPLPLTKAIQKDLEDELNKQLGLNVEVRAADLNSQSLNSPGLLITFLFGFRDSLEYFQQKYPSFKCDEDSKIIIKGKVNYAMLMNPAIDYIKNLESKTDRRKTHILNFWAGGYLNRDAILEKQLKCNLKNFTFATSREYYTHLQDTVSLNDYPLILSNLINFDYLYSQSKGRKLSVGEMSKYVTSGLVPFILPELE